MFRGLDCFRLFGGRFSLLAPLLRCSLIAFVEPGTSGHASRHGAVLQALRRAQEVAHHIQGPDHPPQNCDTAQRPAGILWSATLQGLVQADVKLHRPLKMLCVQSVAVCFIIKV